MSHPHSRCPTTMEALRVSKCLRELHKRVNGVTDIVAVCIDTKGNATLVSSSTDILTLVKASGKITDKALEVNRRKHESKEAQTSFVLR